MRFENMLFSKSVIFSFAIVVILSIVLTFFPLLGALGFEFSTISAIVLSFLSVFISATLISSSEIKNRTRNNFLDTVGSIYIVNLLFLLSAYLIGLTSSLIKGDCFIKEGSIFFLLIPAISVFFSSTLGILAGYFFGRKGILVGLIAIFFLTVYAIWQLYHGVSIFVYNPIFGFFPGPLYDEAIPITNTLIISRLWVFLWGILLLLALRIAYGFRQTSVGVWDVLIFVAVGISIIVISINEPKIGISYTREYITDNILSGSFETDNFIIYYAPGTKEAENIMLIADDHEWRYKQLKEYLNLDSTQKIKSYIYPDVETRKKAIGAGETTIANPLHGEIHLIYDSYPHPILKHELVHVMSAEFGNDLVKISPKIGLLEGVAVAADWRGQKFTPHQWSKVMYEMDIAPEIDDIVGFGFWYAPSEISYTLMGSFSRYLIDTYGIENYKQAYKTGDFSIYEKSVEELSSEWKEYLITVEVPPETKTIAETRFSRPSIFAATCPRKIAQIKIAAYEYFNDDNYYRAKERFSDALKLNNTDPSLIRWLAYSHYYDGNYKRAKEVAGSSASSTNVQKTLLENIKGNSQWHMGGSEEALNTFNSLQNKDIPYYLSRELEIKTSAISEGGLIEENIKQFFGTRNELLQFGYLQEIISEEPTYAPAFYLMGRLLFNEGEFEKAIPNLIEANLIGLPNYKLRNENLRILGISQFAQGNYDQAIVTFNYLLLLEENEAAKAYAQDFIDRSGWMLQNRESNKYQLK